MNWIMNIIQTISKIFKGNKTTMNTTADFSKNNSPTVENSVSLKPENHLNDVNNNGSITFDSHQEIKNYIGVPTTDYSIDQRTRYFFDSIKNAKTIFINEKTIEDENKQTLINNMPRGLAEYLLNELISKKYLKGSTNNPYKMAEKTIYNVEPDCNFFA